MKKKEKCNKCNLISNKQNKKIIITLKTNTKKSIKKIKTVLKGFLRCAGKKQVKVPRLKIRSDKNEK